MKTLYKRWLNVQISEWLFWTALPLALLLNGLITTVPVVGHIIALVCLPGAALLLWRHPVRHTRPYLWIALLALVVHLAVALWITPIAINYYGQKGSSDILQYMSKGQELVSLMWSQPAEAIRLLGRSLAFGTPIFQWLFGLLLLVTGGSLAGLSIIFTWLGSLGGYYFARAYYTHLAREQWGWYVLLMLFFPSAIFWLTFPLKDAYIFAGLGLLTYGLSIFPSARLRHSLPIIVAAELVCFVIRPYNALFYGGAIIGAEGLRLLRARFQHSPINFAGSLTLILFNGLLLLVLVANGFFLQEGLDSPQGIMAYQQVADGSATGPAPEENPTLETPSGAGASNATLPVWLSFPLERLWYVFTVLFRPLPWEATNALTLAASLENIGLLLLSGISLWRWRLIAARVMEDPFLLFALALAALFVLAFSLQVSNFGTMMRVKVTVFPFIFPFIAMALGALQNRIQSARRRAKQVMPHVG